MNRTDDYDFLLELDILFSVEPKLVRLTVEKKDDKYVITKEHREEVR